LEREIKLHFEAADTARHALAGIGAVPFRPRRLQDDRLLDDGAASLQRRGVALRIRQDGTDAFVTFKGPVVPGLMKVREEVESAVVDGQTLLRIFGELGFTPRFRYQKYREEFRLPGLDSLIVALDETPAGVYVELEGQEAEIETAARHLGRAPAEYIRASYRTLFLEYREAHHVSASDMLFQPTA
jgi:adenylate cyclase, class 2